MTSPHYTPEAAATHVEAHGAWTANGKCRAVSNTKAWCNDPAGHPGHHSSPRVNPSGPETLVFWTEDVGCPCDA